MNSRLNVSKFAVAIALFLNKMTDCIIEALANPERERLKHEDTNISEWLKSKVHLIVTFNTVIFHMVFDIYNVEFSALRI